MLLRWFKYPLQPLQPRKDTYVLITGTSSGIGYAMSYEMASRGFNLILVSQRSTALEQLMIELKEKFHNISVRIYSIDLSAPGSAQSLYDWVQSQKLTIDALVNNAGIGNADLFIDSNPTINNKMISLNIITCTQLTQLFLPLLLKQGHGRIHFTSSMTGFTPSPHAAVYGATKAYVTNFAQGVGYEIQRAIQSGKYKVDAEGVAITTLCPGATLTNFATTAHSENALIFKIPFLQSSPKTVAKQAVDALLLGTPQIIPHPLYLLSVWLMRHVPSQFGFATFYTLWGTLDELMGRKKNL